MKTAKAGHLHMLMSSAFSVHSTMCGTLVRGKILTKLYTRQLISNYLDCDQCDQKKLPNVYKSCPKMIDFDTFTKIASECGRFGQINCRQML